MPNSIDKEMLKDWIGLEFAPYFNPTGKKIIDIEGVGSQNVVFRLQHPNQQPTALSLLRSHICFTIDCPPNTIFMMHKAPIQRSAGYFEEDIDTYNKRVKYYESLYERLKLVIDSPLLSEVNPINVVSHRLAFSLIHYWYSKNKADDKNVLKLYSNLLGSTLVIDLLKTWSLLDPETIKQYWLNRSGMSVDSYDIVVDEEHMYLGESESLAKQASETLSNIEKIFSELEVQKGFDYRANPILPYFVAFTSGYKFDWSVADEIISSVSSTKEGTIVDYVNQLAQIAHILTNAQYFRQIIRANHPIRSWLKPNDMEILEKLLGIVTNM